jgi:L-threonylcarbamoyladenylate synthase
MSTKNLPSEQEIKRASDLLCAGKLVAFPTETVYGLGADATNEDAVCAIFQAKGRPSNNPLIVHLDSFDKILRYTDFTRAKDPELLRKRLEAIKVFWPGPLSVVVPKSDEICSAVSAGGTSVALRIPNHPTALSLIAACQLPIAAPSANPSNYISPTTAEHVRSGLGDTVAHILDGGPCTVGIESTVLSLLTDTPTILRPGAITKDQLAGALMCRVDLIQAKAENSGETLLSPGLLAKHYSPRTRVALLDLITEKETVGLRLGLILFSPKSDLKIKPQEIKILSNQGDLTEVAANLFAALRDLDSAKVDLILVDTCEPIGLGAAIMDRLLRAAA